MSTYLSGIHVEAQLDGVNWTDLSADVIQSAGIAVQYGIRANGPLDRVATSGELKFTLRDNNLSLGGRAGYYTPGSPYALPGLSRGCPVRLVLAYGGNRYTKFAGRIANLVPDRSNQVAAITVTDWMDLAAQHELRLMTYRQNLRINQIVPLITANMPIGPAEMELNPGQDVYPDVFDTLRDRTRAAAELIKLATSELGYIYPRYKPGHEREILTVEGRYTRSERTTIQPLEHTPEVSGVLVQESGDRLLLEDGSGLALNGVTFAPVLNRYSYASDETPVNLALETFDRLLQEDGSGLLLDQVALAEVVHPMLAIGLDHGSQVFNQIRYTAYPRQVDVLPNSILWSLNAPLALAAGEVKSNILGRYRDPVGGAARVSGRDMQAPVATTDYLLNSAEDGSGTNLTASLSVTAAYGTEGVAYSLTNTGATPGFVTRLQARGRGVYTYDPVSVLVEDAASKLRNGVRSLTLDLTYQRSIETAGSFASLVLNQYRDASLRVAWVRFLANWDEEQMLMFLEMEPGMRTHVSERVSGVDTDVFINGVSYQITDQLITCTWYTWPAAQVFMAFWQLDTVGRSELNSTTVLGY